ncbi:amidase family protein [uncultured Pseudoteredinibacter sp.]|uniref:amidase family protein n=1 Tax=uncultured Pseudoteredinibacter sp. TaxID=1641701 RepID=UPI00261CDC00|nr:amidase family protein [uncultured Pseudoteredinibacter sp.]
MMKRRDFLGHSAVATMAAGASTGIAANALAKSQPKLASSELAKLDALGLAETIRSGQVSALEVLDDTIARIEALDPKINSVVIKTVDIARQQASKAKPQGVFAGVPYVYKNLAPYKDVPFTGGSRAFVNRIPKTANDLQKSIDGSGAVLMGMSNSPEFGLVATTEPMLYGATHNPWDLTRSPGGSSGGSAAAVAAGLVPIATASDGGGSIRVPACQCGLVGLKYSRYREYSSLKTGFLSSKGCLSHSVRDTAAFLAVTERPDFKGGKVGYVTAASKQRLRIAYHTEDANGLQPHAEVKQAIESTAKLLAGLGHHVEEKKFELNGEELMYHFLSLWSSSPATKKVEAEALLGRAIDSRDFEPMSFYLIEMYKNRPEGSIQKAVAYFKTLAESAAKFYQQYDVYLSPVLNQVAVKLGEHGPKVDPKNLLESSVAYVSHTPTANATGLPSLSLPLHWSDAGLPIGSLFTAGYGQEAKLLALAYELEAALPWQGKWAPNSVVNL